MKKTSFISAGLLLLVIFTSCQINKAKTNNTQEAQSQPPSGNVAVPANNTNTAPCDPAVWKYVYNPDRLEVIDKCKTVTGVIEESDANEDGDQHMLLKLDGGQDELLTKRNIKKKQGDLVIEAVCANNTTLNKVGSTCTGYVNKIQIPSLGDHVKVTGSYVIDTHNGWAEIHPITKIEKM